MKPSHYVVIGEHTLGYIISDDTIGILHASILKGSPYDPLCGDIAWPMAASVRPATSQDFKDFRVLEPQD